MLRGMFEDRIQNVIRELKNGPISCCHRRGPHDCRRGLRARAPSDAANVFKSVLARGEVRIIGATTLSEYKEYIQEDEALARRFRTVQVCEPTIDETRRILYNLGPGWSVTTPCASSTRRSRRPSTCRRATCGNLRLLTR